MRASWKRAAALAVAISTVSFLTSCKSDVDKNDATISADLQTASQKLAAGLTDDAQKILESDAKITSASPQARISAQILRGQSYLDAADSLSRKLEQQEAQITTSLIELEGIGGQLAATAARVSGFQGLNPSAGQQALQQETAAAEKGEGGVWIKGNPAVPSLEDVTKRQGELQKQIDDLTKQRTELVAKRALALQQAANFDHQADAATGSASTALVIQAANQRKEAADDDVKTRDLDTQLLPFQQQLAVVQQQKQAIEAAIASSRDQLQKLEAGWQAVQKQVDQLKSFSSYLLDTKSGAPPAGTTAVGAGATTAPAPERSISSLAADLDQQVKAAQDLRSQIADLLNKAAKSYEDAAGTAGKMVADLKKRVGSQDAAKLPEKHAWQDLIALNDEAAFKLRQANVYAHFARLYSQNLIELAQRNSIARVIVPALKQAGLEAPQPLTSALGDGGALSPAVREPVLKIESDMNKNDFTGYGDVPAQLDQIQAPNPADQEMIAGARADLYYFWADSVLNDVVNAPGQGEGGQLRANLAHVARMINNYGWSLIALLEGKADNQRGRLATALAERKAVAPEARNLLPSTLPPELEEQPAATQPTSQPTGEAAPTTEPAAPTSAPTTAPAAQ